MELWEAFIEDYADEIHSWSMRRVLKIFWHYCEDGSKSVDDLFKMERRGTDVLNEVTAANLTIFK